jgi:hypothetical protein
MASSAPTVVLVHGADSGHDVPAARPAAVVEAVLAAVSAAA